MAASCRYKMMQGNTIGWSMVFLFLVTRETMQQYRREICERYVLSHVPKKDQEGLLGKMDYEKVAEILSYKPEYSFTYESIIVEKKHLCQMKYMRLDDEQHVLMGFRMVDDIVANEREHRKSLAKAVAVAEQSYAAAENANNCRGAS